MDAYFQRLETTLFPGSGFADEARTGALRTLGRAANRIPDADFVREWPRLRRMLVEPLAYRGFEDVIRRAYLASEAAHGDMLTLIDGAAGADGGRVLGKERLSGRYFALTAICRMGPAGRPLLPELERRMADGTIPLGQSSDWDFAARTLRAIGGDPAFIRTHAKLRSDDPKAAEGLERAILLAKNGRRC